jgi:hypothetical protein
MDETSVNKVLEYGRLVYESGRYEEARVILMEFYKISFKNRKNLSKALLGLWLVLAIDIVRNDWEKIISSFITIKESIELFKNTLDDEFRKINFESVIFFNSD